MPSRSQLGNAAQLTLILDRDLHTKLGAYATSQGRHILPIVRQAISEHIDRAQARKAAAEAFERLKPALRDHIDRELQWTPPTANPQTYPLANPQTSTARRGAAAPMSQEIVA